MRPGGREFRDASLSVTVPKSVPEHMRPRMREISDVFVAPASRRQKLATILMNFVCQEADANQITLVLTARAYEDCEDEPLALGPADIAPPRMSSAQLIEWYKRFGFQVLQELPEGTFMARQVIERPRIKPIAAAVSRALH